jgi:thermostable 8-oxoguanine DNA glycosylase
MNDRNFYLERLTERLRELRQRYTDDRAAFYVEASKALLSVARNERERKDAEALLETMKTCRRAGLFD